MTAAGTDTAGMTAVEHAAVDRYERAVESAPGADSLSGLAWQLSSWWGHVDELDSTVHAADRVPSPAAAEYVDEAIAGWFLARQVWLERIATTYLEVTATVSERRPPGVPRPDLRGGSVETSARPRAGLYGFLPEPP